VTQRSSRDWLAELVGFDTTSRGSNLDLIAHVEAYLLGLGARCERTENEAGDKANLHAVLGPDVDGGVVLSGHSDVVPVDGQDWQTDPFVLTEKDGKLYGRGSCDMKGFIACALAAAPRFAEAGLKRPVHFAISYDEEVGCLGAPDMIAKMADKTPKPSCVIVGEPTLMQVVTGHKGLFSVEVEVHGHEAHSSLVESGACASTAAVRLMNFLVEQGDALKAAAPADSPFDPAYGTLTIGQMQGGTAPNILAKHANFFSLMRPTPWDDGPGIGAALKERAREVEAEMQHYAPDAKIDVHIRSDVPPLKPEIDGEAETLARALTGDNARRVVAYGTEAGQFQEAGFSTVVCGPGSIEQAHQPNEFIAISELAKCDAFMEKLTARLTA
jgi:acetylornithine deacetylase